MEEWIWSGACAGCGWAVAPKGRIWTGAGAAERWIWTGAGAAERRWRGSGATAWAFSLLTFLVVVANEHGDWKQFDHYEEYRNTSWRSGCWHSSTPRCSWCGTASDSPAARTCRARSTCSSTSPGISYFLEHDDDNTSASSRLLHVSSCWFTIEAARASTMTTTPARFPGAAER